jgi:hypothetical protein
MEARTANNILTGAPVCIPSITNAFDVIQSPCRNSEGKTCM